MKITAAKVSLNTLKQAVREAINAPVYTIIEAISYKVMPNGVYAVKYRYNSTGKWITVNRFISAKIVLAAAVKQRVFNSKSVEWAIVGKQARTISGAIVNQFGCNCEDFNSEFVPVVDGSKVCKHVIAYYRDLLGVGSLAGMIASRNQTINSLFVTK